jgi:putative DNA primase/helicase
MIDLNDVAPPAPHIHYDLDAIVAGLRDTAASWVPQHFPNGRREGGEWRLANIRGDAPRKNGSCAIALEGPHAGDWYDHDGGEGGGPLNALQHATGLKGRDLYAHAAAITGSTAAPPARRAPPPPAKEKDVAQEITIILARAVPIAGTLAETYLRSRGLTVPSCEDLRFHPDLVHWESRTGWPAMVAVIRDAKGETIGLHRTWLAPDGAGKAPVKNNRKMLGRASGGAVRLSASADGLLALAEGIETALAVMTACPHIPVWAALSASNLEEIELPSGIARVIILADHDASGTGQRAAEAAAFRLYRQGCRVFIASPPQEGDDFNDLLCRAGAQAVRAAVESAAEWRPPAPTSDADRLAAGRSDAPNLPVGFPIIAGSRPLLRADNGDLAALAGETRALLVKCNEPPWLFRMGAMLTWVARDDDARAMAVHLTEDRLKLALAHLIDWRKRNRAGDLVPAHPPTPLVKALLATPNPDLPVLAGIVAAPVFGRAGELVTEPGYHPATRLLHEPPAGFELPPVPERPGAADVAAARSLLLDDLLGDFPFTCEAERAHALALLLLPFVRPLIEGPTPLHLIEKPTPGTGATLLVDAIAVVTTGHSASIMTEGRDEEEWRKRITAKLREAPLMVVIDNLRRPLDAAPVAAALTAPYWEDRILGRSDIIRIPVRCAWVATGNNPQLSNEIARRAVRIRLDAHMDRPWQRDGFRHPNLLAWVHAHRGSLVSACLTLGRAWVEAGRPRDRRATLGSFESWSETMGGILDVAGVPGFLANAEELYELSDAEGTLWRSFVAAWWDRFGTAEVGTADLFPIAGECPWPDARSRVRDRGPACAHPCRRHGAAGAALEACHRRRGIGTR